jgi:hypothetical protein
MMRAPSPAESCCAISFTGPGYRGQFTRCLRLTGLAENDIARGGGIVAGVEITHRRGDLLAAQLVGAEDDRWVRRAVHLGQRI